MRLPRAKAHSKAARGVGRSADQAAAFAAEGLDGRGGVHVGDRNGVVGEVKALERLPAGFDLRDLGHIGHGAAGVEVGQDDLLAVVAEHVGALGHEVHAAEDNVLRVGFGGDFGELVAVAGEVGEADRLRRAGSGGRAGSLSRRVLRARRRCGRPWSGRGARGNFQGCKLVSASRRGRRHVVKNQVHCTPPSVLPIPCGTADGDVESQPAAVDALSLLKMPA